MKNVFLMIAFSLIFLLSCSDDTYWPDVEEEFILAVMVYDEGGQPLEGMSVGRRVELEGFEIFRTDGPEPPEVSDTLRYSYPNPFSGVAVIEFLTTDVREAGLLVADWRGRRIRTLLEGRIQAGSHSVTWDQNDDRGRRVIEGVYRFVLSLTDTLETHRYSRADSIECTVIDHLDPNRREIGVTDATGFFSTRDLDLFPSAQGHRMQTSYDPSAVPTGEFMVSDTVTVVVSTPPPTVEGYIYHMSRRVVLSDGPDYLEFYFVPDDSTAVIASPVPQ